jgi:hypothetical protein
MLHAFDNILAMQHARLLHPRALCQLSGSSKNMSSRQAGWVECVPIVPALQIMRYPATS